MKRYGLFDNNIKKIFNIIENSLKDKYVLIGGVSRVCLSSLFLDKYKHINFNEGFLTNMVIKGFSDIDILFDGDSRDIKNYLEKNKFDFIYDPWENEISIKIDNNKYNLELISIDLIEENRKEYYKKCIERAVNFKIEDISTKILTLEDFILTKMFIKFKEEKDRENKDLEDVKNLLLYLKNCGEVNINLKYIYNNLIYSKKSKEEIERYWKKLNSLLN